MTEIRAAWDLVADAKQQLENLSAAQVAAEAEDENVVIVDIRDQRELYLKGSIPGSFHAPRGMLEFWVDPASEYYRDIFTPDKRYIVYCAGGGRSALAAKTMRDMGYPDVAHLEPGFGGWVEADLPVQDERERSKWVPRSE